MTKSKYIARGGNLKLTEDQSDFVWRRTMPFMDGVGLRLSLSHLLQEAYLQGLADAVEAMRPTIEHEARQ